MSDFESVCDSVERSSFINAPFDILSEELSDEDAHSEFVNILETSTVSSGPKTRGKNHNDI